MLCWVGASSAQCEHCVWCGRHYAVKQGKGPQKGSGSESEEVTDEDDPVGEAEM